MKTRLVTWTHLLCLALVLMLLPLLAGRADAEIYTGSLGEDAAYTYDSDTRTMVISGTGLVEKYISAPPGTDPIVHIVIEEGITGFSDSADFLNTAAVEDVSIPSSMKTVRKDLFGGFTALRSVSIGSGVELIDLRAFMGCTALPSIDIPGSVKKIEWSAFAGCTALESVQLHAGLETISGVAFENTGLRSVVLPETVTTLGTHAFENCTSLVRVTLSDGLKKPAGGCFSGCTALQTVIFGKNTRELGSSMFSGCTALVSISFPDSLTTVGERSFEGCTALRNVSWGKGVKYIRYQAFGHCDALTDVVLPENVTQVYASAFASCALLEKVTIYNSKCKLYDVYDTNPPTFGSPETVVLCGYRGSTTEAFAAQYGYRFEPLDTAPPVFDDVPAGAYYEDAVNWAVANGITNGTSPGKFSPGQVCTRAQVVTFLWRAVGSPTPQRSDCPFNDVKAGAYYYLPVLWALEANVTSGTSAYQFSPNNSCSRAQVVTFLWRTAGKPKPASDRMSFTDIPYDAYYREAVAWAVEQQITTGTTYNAFSPNRACTRAQVVTFLYRYSQISDT